MSNLTNTARRSLPPCSRLAGFIDLAAKLAQKTMGTGMKRNILLSIGALLLGLFIISGCSSSSPEGDNTNLAEQEQAGTPQPPEEYASLENPLSGQAGAVSEGQSLFQANCSSCHGPSGRGDGPASAGLNPKPKNLTQTVPEASDGYLYWRIAEGGLMDPFNSVMPAWRGVLVEDEIWQVVSYLRSISG